MTDQEAGPIDLVSPATSRRALLRRLAVMGLLIVATTFVLRTVPVFDPSLTELVTRLHAVRGDITAQRSGGSAPVRTEGVGRAQEVLKSIADETRRNLVRREGLWRLVAGTDRREIAALKEIERLASSELSALLTAGPTGQQLREQTVDEALARLDDHLAGASPYIPPLRPIEKQAGMEKSAASGSGRVPVMQAFLIFDGLLLVGVAVWFWRRQAKRSCTGKVPN